jgi:hypothetical protein
MVVLYQWLEECQIPNRNSQNSRETLQRQPINRNKLRIEPSVSQNVMLLMIYSSDSRWQNSADENLSFFHQMVEIQIKQLNEQIFLMLIYKWSGGL